MHLSYSTTATKNIDNYKESGDMPMEKMIEEYVVNADLVYLRRMITKEAAHVAGETKREEQFTMTGMTK